MVSLQSRQRASGEARGVKAELVLDCRNEHGEGVLWNALDGHLWWTDIHGKALWAYDPVSKRSERFAAPDRICCFAPRRDGSLVAAFADGFAFFDPRTGRRENIAPFEPDLPQTRLNDGRTDRQGRLIAGGMDEQDFRPISSVFRLDADLTLARLFNSVACANSTCFSPDGRTMYFADSPTCEIVAFDYDPAAGTIGGRRKLASLPKDRGVPDGSCVDAEGFVWNAVWEGYRVDRFSPDGRLDKTIEVPVRKPTCVAFGGQNLDILFITTSRLGSPSDLLEREPASGGLYAVRPGVKGLIDPPFAG
jgi:L-arabinonolactonase